MSIADSARFMALVTIGLNDAYIAVFDAKYHYNFLATNHCHPQW